MLSYIYIVIIDIFVMIRAISKFVGLFIPEPWQETYAHALYNDVLFFSITFSITFGISIGLLIGLKKGLLVYIQHYTLRLFLRYEGVMPFSCILFLDQATERIFLYNLGTSYKFIHRTLQEYFAKQNSHQILDKK